MSNAAGQPPGRHGTVGRPYSALNLRLALALFGLVVSTGSAVLLWLTGFRVVALIAVVLAVVALIDLVVIQRRRRVRHRADPGRRYSLFE